MKIKQSNESAELIRFTDITKEQIVALLKCNCKLDILAKNNVNNTIFGFIYLLDRNDDGTIIVSHAKRGIKKDESIYISGVIDNINKLYLDAVNAMQEESISLSKEQTSFDNVIEICMDKQVYNLNKSLINIIGKTTNLSFFENLISIDYDTNVFILKYKDENLNNFVCSAYFWPSTKDLYIFESSGPIFSYNRPDRELKINSIEDVIDLF